MSSKITVPQLSRHSWAVASWPNDVFPGNSDAGRQLIRKHRAALVKIGALTRVGKHLVVIGQEYTEWLLAQASRVSSFGIAPNYPEHAHKRRGKNQRVRSNLKT
jgi:hypothetical protein